MANSKTGLPGKGTCEGRNASDAWSPELQRVLNPLYEHRYRFGLYETDVIPVGMVAVDRGRFYAPIAGLPGGKAAMVLDYFFIDEVEVTNRAYKEFVDAGGYAIPAYWKEEFKKNGRSPGPKPQKRLWTARADPDPPHGSWATIPMAGMTTPSQA